MPEKVRVGLIGCGGIARRHVEWFLDQADCEIVGLCDLSEEATQGRLSE